MAWGSKSRHERGYGAAWDKLRKQIMERDAGLCQPCKRLGKYTPAHAVDHITSKAKAAKLKWTQAQIDHPSNLQAICGPCHLVKSNEEQGKTLRPKVRIGADGCAPWASRSTRSLPIPHRLFRPECRCSVGGKRAPPRSATDGGLSARSGAL